MDVFKDLNKQWKTVSIVTYNMDIAKQTQKIISIVDGKVLSIDNN